MKLTSCLTTSVDVRASTVAVASGPRPRQGALVLDADATASEAGPADAGLHLGGRDHRRDGAGNSNDNEATGTLFNRLFEIRAIYKEHSIPVNMMPGYFIIKFKIRGASMTSKNQ